MHKITGLAVYFSNFQGLLFRVGITKKDYKAFIETASKSCKACTKY